MPHTQHYPVEDVLVDLLEVSEVYRVYEELTSPAAAAVCLCSSTLMRPRHDAVRSWPLYMGDKRCFLQALVNSWYFVSGLAWLSFSSRRLYFFLLLSD